MGKALPNNAIAKIKEIGASSLPDSPSQAGFSAKQVKNAIDRPATLLTHWLENVEKRIDGGSELIIVVNSLPDFATSGYDMGKIIFNRTEKKFYAVGLSNYVVLGYGLDIVKTMLDTLDGYFSSGKAKKAIADEDNNNIKFTYETKADATSKDNANVHLAGSETITGAKTFTANMKLGSSGSDNSKTFDTYFTTNLRGPVNSYTILPGNSGFTLGSSSYPWHTVHAQYLSVSETISHGAYTITLPSQTGTLTTASDVATAKSEAISSAASTAQSKVDALATAMDFENGAFGTITASTLNVTTMNVTNTETKTATLEDQFLEMLAGNTVAYGSNYVGFVFTKYDATNDFFVGIYNDTLMIGDCTAARDSNGKITAITPVSLEPLMTRAASNALANGHLIKWDSTNLRAVDAGVSDTDISSVLTQESNRVTAETNRGTAETARVNAENARKLQEKYRVMNHPYPITQSEYNTLTANSNAGRFGVHLSTPLVEGEDPELIYTVYASQALAEAADETYIFPIQDNVQYPAKNVGGDSPYLNIPAAPSSDGTYTLKCSVSSGVVTYSWEADE